MNCKTDVEGRIADPGNFRPSVGVYAGLLYRELLGLRLEATFGTITATDKKATKKVLKNRNLSFKSNITEISLLAEFHPLKLKQAYTPALSFYLLAGVGYFSFNPQASLNNKWIALQPLHTEGQGFPETNIPNYKLSQINLPLGGGLQYNLSERFVLRGEAVYRLLNTDYLDDVSRKYIRPVLFDKYLSATDAELAKRLADRSGELTGDVVSKAGERRGSPQKDAYYSINLKLGIKLDKVGNNISNKRVRKATGCYRF